MRIKENLNFLIEERGIMNKFLAEKLEVSSANITRYRKGKNIPPIEKIIKLCEIFSVNLSDFVLTDLSKEKGKNTSKVMEPGVTYEKSIEEKNRRLQSRINELELALHRHIKDRDILRKYIEDA